MQHTAGKLPEDLFIRVIIQNVHKGSKRTVQAAFNSLLLGDEADSPDWGRGSGSFEVSSQLSLGCFKAVEVFKNLQKAKSGRGDLD